jgi:hypothetical protein
MKYVTQAMPLGDGLPLAATRSPFSGHWTLILRDAECEVEAVTTRAAMNAAGKKLMEAKAKLK